MKRELIYIGEDYTLVKRLDDASGSQFDWRTYRTVDEFLHSLHRQAFGSPLSSVGKEAHGDWDAWVREMLSPVLLDIDCQRHQPRDAVRRIHSVSPTLPIILLLSKANEDVLASAWVGGAEFVFARPLRESNPESVLESIEAAFQKAEGWKESVRSAAAGGVAAQFGVAAPRATS